MRDSHRCHGTIFVALARLLAALEVRTGRALGEVSPVTLPAGPSAPT